MFVVLPNQLFENLDAIRLSKQKTVYIVEEPLYFYDQSIRPLRYNKIKLAYLVACMRVYYDYVRKNLKGYDVVYIKYDDVAEWHKLAMHRESEIVHMYDPVDKDIKKKYDGLNVQWHKTKLFILSFENLKEFHQKHGGKERVSHVHFFSFVKKQLGILAGISSQDKYNRESLPKQFKSNYREIRYDTKDVVKSYYDFAAKYINSHNKFRDNPGSCEKLGIWPITFKDSKNAFMGFLSTRFDNFGKFQDAIDVHDPFLFHSCISPMMNIGLLSSEYVLSAVLKDESDISNTEGFLRQVVGWREYMRYLYEFRYDEIIGSNHFGSVRRFAKHVWHTGSFGLGNLDHEIQKGMLYGYSQHIVRLMVFLNVFVMMQIHPEDVYKWFMENIAMDAYDWVMRTNIYCMGWYYTKAMTKPYVSTSNYLMKMGNYPKGKWCEVWDALFYNFLSRNKKKLIEGGSVYLRNLKYFENLPREKQQKILNVARDFINTCTK